MTIEEIYYSEDLSVRSFNVCNDNDLKDLSAILKHYRENRTFDNLRNCGRKSNEELTALCLKYTDYDSNHFSEPLKPEKQLITTITNFTRTQREIVNSFIEINTNNLSNRSKNAITSFLNGNLKIRNISERILANDKFNFQDIKNVGTKTVTELKSFFDTIIDFIEKVAEVENENDLVALRNRFFIEKTFSISSIPIEILESQSIFSLVDFLINKDVIFEKNENIIFIKAFKLYDKQPELTLDEIAEEISISRERVRQIRKGILEDLFNNLQFVKQIEDDLYQKYGIDENKMLINIDEDLNVQINEFNDTSFTREFNSILIYLFFSDKFDLIGEIGDVLQPKTFNSRDRHNWGSFYLVAKELTNQFDFNNFVDDIHSRINGRIEETYNFHFKSYLNNFVKNEDSSIISLVFPAAERIINQEFDLLIDLNDDIVFKRNTLKKVPEYAIEALEKLSVPSKIEEIYKIIEKDYPGITKSHDALRGSLQRTSEIIYFGRSSTYGLKKWETEKEGIKGGTIKDIILDYLEDNNCPIHILELVNEVHKYREETNAKNIITNLKLDPQKNFIIFNQGFIGLSRRSYNSKLSDLPKFLGKSITHFIKKNDRINRLKVEAYFSNQLDISHRNMKFIIDYLIEQQFVFIDNQNNLST
ncbi:MAG: sigma factor-like helix-turn-helix DNA-binding protein [Flavobacterium sp.]|uniref:sigma factor-like helix-turn-helix DNA-binding protein n=1 Tax=Flavobacterium sp. TaxID=239 RepID=UPI003BC85065